MRILEKEVEIWDGRFTRPCERHFSISLCTACMGRAHDLARTLQRNMIENAAYSKLEFVLLDYNSQDHLEEWVRANMLPDVESGRLVYVRTTEPKYFHMSHSRNVAIKVASGEIVCNVDADNWTGPGFAEALNRLGNEQPARAVFARGTRLLRGRIGFFKQEWEEILGGYDEDIQNYGHEDIDLVRRAYLHGFKLMPFGAAFISRIGTSGVEKVANMEVKDWKQTEAENQMTSRAKLERGALKANEGREWGKATLMKNFSEEIRL